METTRASVHVVVGFDFSPLAELALREAAALACERPDLAIHVVHARSEIGKQNRNSTSPKEDVNHELEEALRTAAQQALHDEGAGEGVEIFTHALIGDPAAAIVDMAQDVDAELIIVGTHGRRGIKRLVLGSVAEEVMRAASCPVLVMRPRKRAESARFMPEPPCPDCVEVREATGGVGWWCDVHARPWVPAHRYSYQGGDLRPYHPDGLG